MPSAIVSKCPWVSLVSPVLTRRDVRTRRLDAIFQRNSICHWTSLRSGERGPLPSAQAGGKIAVGVAGAGDYFRNAVAPNVSHGVEQCGILTSSSSVTTLWGTVACFGQFVESNPVSVQNVVIAVISALSWYLRSLSCGCVPCLMITVSFV